jgi:hypothetical protein
MQERPLLLNACYVIPLRERLAVHLRRLVVLPYLALRYRLRRLFPTNLARPGDVVRVFMRDYEAPKILQTLGIRERDATAAVKVATYLHNITHPLGEITEMTATRSVRTERHCPYARFLKPEICRDLVSGPAFQGLCEAIHPDLVHLHTKYLSGGDDCCDITFELKR